MKTHHLKFASYMAAKHNLSEDDVWNTAICLLTYLEELQRTDHEIKIVKKECVVNTLAPVWKTN